MKLAVILPVYNAELYLKECLDSLFNQTFTDFCVLAINDASTDKSGDMLEQYAKNEPRLRVYHFEQNQGETTATQFAFDLLEYMQVEYVARMDSDDICLPERFEKQITFLDQNLHIDVVGSNMIIFGNAQGETNIPLNDEDIKVNFLLGIANILNPTSVYRQSSIKPLKVKYDVLPTACDYAMWVELALHKKVFANISEPLIHYRRHSEQSSNKKKLIADCALKTLTRYIQALFPELTNEESSALSRICYSYGTIQISLDECQLILGTEKKITKSLESVLGENRERIIEVIKDKYHIIRNAIGQN